MRLYFSIIGILYIKHRGKGKIAKVLFRLMKTTEEIEETQKMIEEFKSKKGEIRMRTKAYSEELNAETLENVTGGGFVSKPQTLPERLGWNKWWLKRRPPYGD